MGRGEKAAVSKGGELVSKPGPFSCRCPRDCRCPRYPWQDGLLSSIAVDPPSPGWKEGVGMGLTPRLAAGGGRCSWLSPWCPARPARPVHGCALAKARFLAPWAVAGVHPGRQSLCEKGIKRNVSGNAVNHTNSLILLLRNMLCRRLHHQVVFDLTPFSYKIRAPELAGRACKVAGNLIA